LHHFCWFSMNSMKFHQLCIPWNPMKSPRKLLQIIAMGPIQKCPFKEMPTLTPVLRVEVMGWNVPTVYIVFGCPMEWVEWRDGLSKLPFSNPLDLLGFSDPT
jgi:hypothetical protein